jgi:hypothetical protein
MAAAVVLAGSHRGQVDDYVATLHRVGLRTGRSTVQAARSFCAKLERARGWAELSSARQVDAICKARAFASWLLVTCQLTASADILGRVDLRLGNAARNYCPNACERLGINPNDIALQWNTLAKLTAITGTPPERISTAEFEAARTAIIGAYADHRRLRRARPAELGPEHGRDLPPAPAHPVPRRPARHPRPAGQPATSLGDRLGSGRRRVRRGSPLLHRPGRSQPAALHRETHRARPARVRHLARPRPPRGW